LIPIAAQKKPIMDSSKNIWSELPLATGIATFVCYAGVFNDVIEIKEVASRLGISSPTEFHTVLNQLCCEGRLILKDGFAGLPCFEDKASVKAAKITTARNLINSRMGCLRKIGRNPLVKFVGVSGSLAAGNPTKDRNSEIDLDVFVITRNQCLWLYSIWLALKNNLWLLWSKLLPTGGEKVRLCLNYIMDESDPLIANRNFYTATEMRNLIPVVGLDAHRKFIQINSWVDYYYPGMSGISPPVASSPTHQINKIFYAVYNTMKDIKWCLRTHPLNNLHSLCGNKFNVQGPHCGGYQLMVQKKFNRLAGQWFPDLLGTDLIQKLFPDQLSEEVRSGNVDLITIAEDAGYDYSKYA
jgi:hypothetical protein